MVSRVGTILVVEDDPGIARNLSLLLAGEGYAVETVDRQRTAIVALQEGNHDLALVDLALPDGSGYAVCTAARQAGVPVIFLTASADELSVVTGLELGAEDYVVKPFRPLELLSRIKAVLRRSGRADPVVQIGPLRIDLVRGVVHRGGVEVFLTAMEYKLLLVFADNRGAVLTRERLLREIWDSGGEYVTDNTLTVYIKRLRDKVEDDPQDPQIIKTVRGLGYRLGE